jgi:hypothetical protein
MFSMLEHPKLDHCQRTVYHITHLKALINLFVVLGTNLIVPVDVRCILSLKFNWQ